MLQNVIHKQKGFVLIVVLLFLQQFAMLSVAMISQHILSIKMSNEYQQKHHVFQSAEKLLRNINDSMFEEDNCEIPVLDAALMRTQSLTWWEENACSGLSGSFKYYYVFEKLSENIVRMTLLVMQNNAREILQNTLVKIDNAKQPKNWREL